MYIITLHTLNYYEDKYLSVFLRTLSIQQKYISMNNHALLYIYA